MCPDASKAAKSPRSQACLRPVNDSRRKKFTLPAPPPRPAPPPPEADENQEVFDFTPLPF